MPSNRKRPPVKLEGRESCEFLNPSGYVAIVVILADVCVAVSLVIGPAVVVQEVWGAETMSPVNVLETGRYVKLRPPRRKTAQRRLSSSSATSAARRAAPSADR